ncbi:MAG: 4Fe-4S dicluster domain-containing protein [Ruminococcaceae bacterium]|nr:4Fe-4S dicluster domain-containing protein [Oscillospiraceae bacterium]
MIYKQFQDLKLSMLGFGTMRLPLLADGVTIDEAQVEQMTAYAMEHGINYFDTAYPYHQGNSERVIGRVLSQYPRESFYLATKYPGHQIASSYDPAAIFEEQLEKCGVEYFDFYLLHNVYERSIDTYMDPQWGILDYFLEQKRLGRIKHLGFSTHGSVPVLEKFLNYCGEHMEFCQIQLNYLDWTLQDARAKCALLNKWNIPIWVMEPVRGGKLANLNDEMRSTLTALRSDESVPAWCFRWLQGIEGVTMVLSGMSNMAQMVDNVKTFEAPRPLSETEQEALRTIAAQLSNSVPCTACRYCCDGCPQGLDIPTLLAFYNDLKVTPSFLLGMRVEALPPEKRPAACIGCGACAAICPQNIDIPAALSDMARILETLPSWEAVCREREEAAKRGK